MPRTPCSQGRWQLPGLTSLLPAKGPLSLSSWVTPCLLGLHVRGQQCQGYTEGTVGQDCTGAYVFPTTQKTRGTPEGSFKSLPGCAPTLWVVIVWHPSLLAVLTLHSSGPRSLGSMVLCLGRGLLLLVASGCPFSWSSKSPTAGSVLLHFLLRGGPSFLK